MADNKNSLMGIGNFSQPAGSAVQAKQAAVSDAARMKTFLLSTPDDLHVAATAAIQGNDAGKAALVNDLRTLDRTSLIAKYGAEGMEQASRFYGAVRDVRQLKEQERTAAQVAGDSALDFASMATHTLGGAAVFATQAVDSALGAPARIINRITGEETVGELPAMAPHMSKALGWATGQLNGMQTDLKQERAAQHRLEGSLNQQDSAAAYAAATKDLPEGMSSEKTEAWFKKQGTDFLDAVKNYGDDPIMAGALIPEMIGSMAPTTLAIRAAGKIGARKILARQGVSDDAMEAALASGAGKALVNQQAVRAAPAAIVATEAGSSVAQVQQEMLNMKEEDFAGNAQYAEYRANDYTHEEAVNRLASKAGEAALLTTAPIALAAGKFAAKFDADPFGVLSSGKIGSSLLSGAASTGKEMIEETIQEAGNTFATNVGLNWAGQDVALDRGVAAGAAEGFVGGLAGTAAMQSPGVALGTLKEVGGPVAGAIGSAVSKAVDARVASVDAANDAASAVGTDAMTTASQKADESAAAMLAALAAPQPTQTPASTETADGSLGMNENVAPPVDAAPSPQEVSATALSKVAFLDTEEAAQYAEIYPDLVGKPVAVVDPATGTEVMQTPNVSRMQVMLADSKAITSKTTPKEDKLGIAFRILGNVDALRSLESDSVQEAMSSIAPDNEAHAHRASLIDYAKKVESTPAMQAAYAEVKALKPEQVESMLPLQQMQDGSLDENTKDSVRMLLEMIGKTNVGAVNPEHLKLVRNQITPTEGVTPNQTKPSQSEPASPAQVARNKSLDVSIAIAEAAKASDMSKRQLEAAQEASIKALPVEAQELVRKGSYKTRDIVRGEIHSARDQEIDPNKRGLLSISDHRRVFGEAMSAGRVTEARKATESLREFAMSMVNKMAAINKSSENSDNKPVPYQAFGPFGEYTDKTGAFANKRSIKSISYTADVHTDASTVVSAYNAIVSTYAEELGVDAKALVLAVPEIHKSMREAYDLALSRLPEMKRSAAATKSTAVTASLDDLQSSASFADQQAAVLALPAAAPVTPAAPSVPVTAAGKVTPSGLPIGGVELPAKKASAAKYLPKDQAKADLATKFIGFGSENSSTRVYQEAFGDRANVSQTDGGKYSNEDVVFISVEGNRAGRVPPQYSEIDKAMEAGAEFVTDTPANRDAAANPYNVGEREVAQYLESEGYVEYEPGRWADGSKALSMAEANEAEAVLRKEKATRRAAEKTIAEATPKTTGNAEADAMDAAVAATQSDRDKRAENAEKVAKAKQKEEEAAEAAKPKESAAATWFKAMKDVLVTPPKMVNRFLNSFRPKKNNTSTFLSHDSPAEYVNQNISDLSTGTNRVVQNLSADQMDGLGHLVNKVIPGVVKRIQGSFDKALVLDRTGAKEGSRASQWLYDLVHGDADVLAYSNALPANFAMVEEDGSYTLEPRVIEAATMAALEWVITNNSRSRPWLKDDQINSILGLPRSTRVTGPMRKMVQSGSTTQQSLLDIANKTMELLGIEADKSASTSFTQGVFKGVAANVLSTLAKADVIDILTYTAEDHGIAKKTYSFVSATKDAKTSTDLTQTALRDLATMPDLFSRVFSADVDQRMYIGEGPKKQSSTQIRSDFAELTEAQIELIKDRQETPFLMNMPVVGLWKALGTQTLADMLGYRHFDPKKTNKTLATKISGKNDSLLSDIEGVQKYLVGATQYAEANGEEVGKVKIFFDWAISSVGRMQQRGLVTPQGNKITREMITATNATIDLLDEAGDAGQVGDLWIAVAQSAGISIEKMSREDAIQRAKGIMLEGALTPAVDIMLAYLRTGEISDAQKAELQAAIKASKAKPTMKLVHAIFTVARMEHALDQGIEASSAFETSLAIEADGKTDGPINAMIHMTVGRFNKRFVDSMAKGGWFLGKARMTLNDYISKDKDDLYHMAAVEFTRELTLKLKTLKGKELDYALSMMRAMDALLPGFRIKTANDSDPTDLTFAIERDVPKNPLTVFLYGSGVDGISGKILSAMETVLYTLMTEIAESGQSWENHPKFAEHPKLKQDLEVLLSNRVAPDGALVPGKPYDVVAKLLNKPVEGELSSLDAENLTKGITEFFGTPLTDAIDTVTGNLSTNMKLAQQASQIQSIVFADAFNAELETRLKAYQAKEGAGRLLPEDQMMEVFKEAMRVAPIYETSQQEFHISGVEKTDGTAVVSTDFSNALRGTARVPVAGSASVKVSPYMTIGLGDGQMVMNIYLEKDGSLKATLPVFDGIEIGVDQAHAASRHINKAVFKGWMGTNTYRSIQQGYMQMLLRVDMSKLSKASIEALNAAMKLQKGDSATLGHLTGYLYQLREYADQSEARKIALAKVNSWIDHMAGMGEPHNNPGEMIDDAEIVDRLNELYEEALAEVQENNRSSALKAPTQTNTQQTLAVVRQVGTAVPGHKSTFALKGKDAVALVTKELGATPEQIELMGLIEKAGVLDDLGIYRGSSAELTRLKRRLFNKAKNPDVTANLDGDAIQEGQTFVNAGIVFLNNASPETTLHETIHAYTAKAVNAYYEDPASVPEHVRDAIKRLEVLSDEFTLIRSDLMPEHMKTVFNTVRGILLDPAYSKAEKIDEFLAWSLSNQGLIQLGKQTVIRNPLAVVARKAVVLLKKLLGLAQTVDNSLFSQIRFNAQILGTHRPAADLAEAQSEVEKGLNQIYGINPTLTEVESGFVTKLQAHLTATMPDPANGALYNLFQAAVTDLKTMGQKASAMAMQQSYAMNAREQAAFEAVYAVMMSDMTLNASTVRKANRLFDHVLQNISEADFLALDGLTPQTASLPEYTDASAKVAMLTGDIGYGRNKAGRTDLLASFLALAQVHPAMRGVLAKMDAPKSINVQWDSVDSALRSIGNSAVDSLTTLSVTRARQPKNVANQLDILAGALGEVETTHKLLAAIDKYSPLETVNDYLSEKISGASEKSSDYLRTQAAKRTNKKVAGALNLASMIAALGNKDTSKAAGDKLTDIMNAADGWHSVRALLTDFRGMTADNAGVFRLMNQVKAQVDAIRQDFREQVPELLAKAFTKRPTKSDWAKFHHGMAQGDLLALGKADALALLKDPSQLRTLTRAAEDRLRTLAGKRTNAYQGKAKALAMYMVRRRIISNNLLRNSYAIARLVGENNLGKKAATPELMDAIDRLTTLYAYGLQDKATRKAMSDYANEDEAGMFTLMGYLEQTRQSEIDRLAETAVGANEEVARLNGWKGYAPATIQDGAEIIVEDDKESARLLRLGYVRIGDYTNSGGVYRGSRGYYQTAVGTRNAFRQGVAQTVHASWQGVDVRTGVSRSPDTSGAVFGTNARYIHGDIASRGFDNNLTADLHLLPVVDRDGKVVAYEWPLDQARLQGLKRDTHLGRMLGVWSGRISEESQSDHFNKELLKVLKEVYDAAGGKLGTDFVNIADENQNDAVYKDAWDTLGWRIKKDAAALFGQKDFFPVRKDMANDAVGFRAAGLTDAFTGTTRWSADTQEKMVRAATFVLGKDAFARLKKNEERWTGVISYMKTNVVVRALEVVVFNVLSNNYYLLLNGISPWKVVKGNRDKFLETMTYVKNREQILALEVKLAGLKNNAVAAKSIKTRIMVYEDANAALSIMPLIRAGELSTVSESLTEADIAIREGDLGAYIERMTDKLPGVGKTIAKNVLITKDTALYQGLNRAVQYGDFVAKAILFDHLTKEKGKTEREALDAISEEFVNYNRLSGRGRDFLESFGMLWFYNYKLRISKIAVKMIRDRPLNALMMSVGIGAPAGLDAPMDSSIFGKVLEGNLGYSISPQMGFHSFGLNPFYQVVN